MNDKISVIVPVYNAELTLDRCIKSIINQIYRPLQVILVDDGSTDQSAVICDVLAEKYIDRDIEILAVHQQNGGASAARNAGINYATGEYVAFIDSDDIIVPEYFSDLISLQNDVRDFGHVCCGFISILYGNKKYVYNEKETISIVDRKDYMHLCEKVMVQSPCLRLYRTEVIINNNIRMPVDLNLGEDLLFNLEYFDALDNTSFGIINKANYIYNDKNEESLSHKYRENLLVINNLIHKRIKKYLIKWGAFDSKSKEKFYNKVFYDYLAVLDNTFHSSCSWSMRKKICYNSAVIKSKGFKKALARTTIALPYPVKFAYNSGSYPLVFITKRLYYGFHKMISSMRRYIKS